MVQLYAVGVLSGVVIDNRDTVMDVTLIYEGFPLAGARATGAIVNAISLTSCAITCLSPASSPSSPSPPLPPKSTPRRSARSCGRCGRPGWSAGLSTTSRCARRRTRGRDGHRPRCSSTGEGGNPLSSAGMKRRATVKKRARRNRRVPRKVEALHLVNGRVPRERGHVGKGNPIGSVILRSTGNLLNFRDIWPPARRARQPESDGMSMTLQDVEQRQYIWLGLVVTGDVATYVFRISPA
jgi:actin-related protein 9